MGEQTFTRPDILQGANGVAGVAVFEELFAQAHGERLEGGNLADAVLARTLGGQQFEGGLILSGLEERVQCQHGGASAMHVLGVGADGLEGFGCFFLVVGRQQSRRGEEGGILAPAGAGELLHEFLQCDLRFGLLSGLDQADPAPEGEVFLLLRSEFFKFLCFFDGADGGGELLGLQESGSEVEAHMRQELFGLGGGSVVGEELLVAGHGLRIALLVVSRIGADDEVARRACLGRFLLGAQWRGHEPEEGREEGPPFSGAIHGVKMGRVSRLGRGQNYISAAAGAGRMSGMEDLRAKLEERVLRGITRPESEPLEMLLPDLHAFHFGHNAPYRAFCQSLGVDEGIAHWRSIPCVPQAAFKHSDLRAFPAKETAKTFRTSGTTGEGFGRHHFRTLAVYETAVREGWRRARLPAGPFLVMAPHPEEAPSSSLSHMLATLAPREAFVAPGGNIDVARLRDALGSVCLLGTALGFLHLMEKLGDNHLALPAGSTAMETGGYKGSGRDISRAELYTMIEDKLGIASGDIFNEYGMTELSSQFYARGPHGLHQGPPWVRAVVADPVTLTDVAEGETGIVLIWDAANVGSVTGIRTQDLAIRRGDTFELLGRDPSALPRGCSRAADEWLSR